MIDRRRFGALGLTALAGGAMAATAEPAHAAPQFKDVPTTHQFYKEISWMASQGIATGYPDGTYRPQDSVKRDAFAAFLYRLKGKPAFTPPKKSPFKDVSTKNYFYKEITWCHANGILRGWADGTFRPLTPIQRDAAVVVFYRLAGSPDPGLIVDYADTRSSIFRKDIYWGRSNGVMSGWPDLTYRPGNYIDRDATAALFYRYVNGGIWGKGVRVHGAFADQYFRTSRAQWGPLGYAKYNQHDIPGGMKQVFTKGIIMWKKGIGAHRVVEPMLSIYRAKGDSQGPLGFPLANEVSDGYVVTQKFEGGTLSKTIRTRPAPSPYYVPNDNHITAWTSGAGAALKYSTSGSAIVNGTRVRFIWETMRKIGYVSSIPRTSGMTFNRTLEAAVKRFQSRYGLKADGVVGPGTWAKMNQYRGTNLPFDMDKYIAATRQSARGGNASARIRAMYDYFTYFEGRSPYTWGGAGYGSQLWAGFDCSGLVYQMVAAGGILIESTNPVDHARKDYRSTHSIYSDSKLRSYPIRERRNGDIITFSNSISRTLSGIRHNGIFWNGYLLEAMGSGVVRTRWNGEVLRGNRYPMPQVKRPFV